MSDPTRPPDAAPPIPTGLTPDRVPEFAPRASGRQAGLRIPSLGADGAHGGTAPPEAGAAAAGTAGTAAVASATRRERPLRSAVVCALIAVVGAVVFAAAASGAAGGANPCATAPHDRLPAHEGHPTAAATCVDTTFGELSAPENNPTLLIVAAPTTVQPGEDIQLQVSVRNLVRDQFPASAHGGYLAEPAELTAEGLTRGHVHGACRVLRNDREAPLPDRNAAFAAIEDGGGGTTPDRVELHLSGRDAAGQPLFPAGALVHCAAWAGDGSHRIPMDAFADQVPAFDAVRITIAS
jgi:hypothetical protein